MQKPLKTLRTLLGISTILIVTSCKSIRFNPDAYRASHYLEAIVNENEDVVYSYDERFSEFACMHKTKWIELRNLIQFAEMRKSDKDFMLDKIDKVFDARTD